MINKEKNNISKNALDNVVISRIYQQICLISGLLFLTGSILKFTFNANIFLIGSYVLIGFSFLLLVKFFTEKTLIAARYILLVLFLSTVTLGFILNGGIYSPNIYFLPPIMVVVFFILEKKYRITISALIATLVTILYGTQYFYPDYIVYYDIEETAFNIERTIGILTSIGFTIGLVYKILLQYGSSKDEAFHSEKVKSEFLEIMSHMIRTPLNSINGFGRILVEEKLSAAEKKLFIKKMKSNAESLSFLINDLSDLAIIQDKSIKLRPSKFKIALLIEELEEICNTRLGENTNQVDFIVNATDEIKEIMIYCDYQRLQKVIWHILQNSFKFTQKGTVTFLTSINKKTKELVFSVLDTGIGITPDQQKQLFKLINKQNAGFNIKEEGTGIGLNIAQGLIHAMGGEVEITSKPGIGTQVYISLPNKIMI